MQKMRILRRLLPVMLLLAQAGHAIKLPSGRSPWRSRYLILPVPSKDSPHAQES